MQVLRKSHGEKSKKKKVKKYEETGMEIWF